MNIPQARYICVMKGQAVRVQIYLGQQGVNGGGPANWVRKWIDLLTRVYALPDIQTTTGSVRVSDHVLVDILNEPDFLGIQCARASCSSPSYNWAARVLCMSVMAHAMVAHF